MEDISYEDLIRIYSEENCCQFETINYWRMRLSIFCQETNSLSFTFPTIISKNTLYGISPTNFEKTIHKLIAQDNIIQKSKLHALTTDYFSKCNEHENIQDAVMKWSSTFVKSIYDSWNTENKQELFLLVDLLEQIRICVLQYIKNKGNVESIFFIDDNSKNSGSTVANNNNLNRSWITFLKMIECTDDTNFKQITQFLYNITPEDSYHLLLYMLHKQDAVLSKDKKLVMIKAKKEKDQMNYNLFQFLIKSNKIESISESDVNTFYLQSSIRQLEGKCIDLEIKAENLLNSAKLAKVKGDQASALMYLHLRRNTQRMRDNFLKSLIKLNEANEVILQSIFEFILKISFCNVKKIEELGINIMVAGAYESATLGLQSIRKENNIDVEKIENIYEQLQEEMDYAEEVDKAIGSLNVAMTGDEKEELENELQDIIEQQSKLNSNGLNTTISSSKTLQNNGYSTSSAFSNLTDLKNALPTIEGSQIDKGDHKKLAVTG